MRRDHEEIALLTHADDRRVLEVTRVAVVHLEEHDRHALRDAVLATDLGLLLRQRPLPGSVRHEHLERAVEADVGPEHPRRVVGEAKLLEPHLLGPPKPRENRDCQHAADKDRRDDDAVGPLDHVGDRGVDKHETDHEEVGERCAAAKDAPSVGRQGLVADVDERGDRGTGHEHEHAGGIGAALCRHVGVERPGDEQVDRREGEHEWPVSRRPFRGHAVPRQIARHHVQQTRHRRRPGEPEDEDCADVVDRAKHAAKQRADRMRALAMRDIGQGPVHGLALHRLELEFVGGDERVGAGDERRGDQKHRHDQGGRDEQFPGVGDPGRGIGGIVLRSLHEMNL